MFTLFHGISGFLITLVLVEIGFVRASMPVLVSAFFLSMLPDMDLVSIRTMKDHHESLFHAPVFWMLAGMIVSLVNYVEGIRLLIHALFHIFNDYMAAVTTGIYPFYPFSNNEYSFLDIKPDKGNFDLGDREGFGNYIKFYLENRLVVFYELAVCVLGILAFFLI